MDYIYTLYLFNTASRSLPVSLCDIIMCVQVLVFLCVCNCTHMTEGHARHLAFNNDLPIQSGIRRIAYTSFFMNLNLYSYYLTLLTAFLFFCDIHTPSTCAGVSAAQRHMHNQINCPSHNYVMLGLSVRTSSKWLPTVQKMVMCLLHSWHNDIRTSNMYVLLN